MAVITNNSTPTPTSDSKAVMSKTALVSRTDTTFTTRFVLPAQATILGFTVSNTGATASDAATTAVINARFSGGTAIRNGIDVKGTAQVSGQALGGINLQSAAATSSGDMQIQLQYAETGTASTTGGPWIVSIIYNP